LTFSADNSRNNSERIRNEAVRLMREREEKTVLTQRDADRRIGERLHDVTFWRSELQVTASRMKAKLARLCKMQKMFQLLNDPA
jgi:hypothetical protein